MNNNLKNSKVDNPKNVKKSPRKTSNIFKIVQRDDSNNTNKHMQKHFKDALNTVAM